MATKYLHKKAMKIPLYNGTFIVVLTNSVSKLNELIPLHGKGHIYATTWSYPYKEMQGYFIVLNDESEMGKLTPGTITHEALHCANMIANDRGFIPTFENDEPMAYLAEWIADEVWAFIKEKEFNVHM